MDKKTLYFELLNDMENILNKHKETQIKWQEFDPTRNIPVEPFEDIKNPEQWTPFGSLKTSIENLNRKASRNVE